MQRGNICVFLLKYRIKPEPNLMLCDPWLLVNYFTINEKKLMQINLSTEHAFNCM